MKRLPRSDRSPFAVALAAMAVFVLPMALFLFRFRLDAPFYFLAQDSFYYLSIALHSAHAPFFTIDGLHPTNGFHPLWEWTLFAISHLRFFRLDDASILPRFFALDLTIVGAAVALLAGYVYRLTHRPWLSIVAVCPGLLWLVVGIGAPAYLNLWASVNGMETGVELLFFAAVLHLLGTDFRFSMRFVLASIGLGLLVLSRLDDVFFLFAIAGVALFQSPAIERPRRLAALGLPGLMIVAYLLYNHHSLGVWMPVSGMAKAGKGYRAGIAESIRLLEGWPFFAMNPNAIAFSYGNVFVMVAQMLAPMGVAVAWLLWARHRPAAANPVLQAIALGVLLKGSYNFLRVPIGYQGAWYYGASIATANILLALFLSEALRRWNTARPDLGITPAVPSGVTPAVSSRVRWFGPLALLCLSFLAFNITATRASQNGMASTRDAWLERDHLAAAIRSVTSAPFLEFQDGELSFATGLPAISGFGLAADPPAVRAQHDGTFFQLLAERGVTIAAASNVYPSAIDVSAQNKAIFPIWGFNRKEVENFCFQPFWTDPKGNIVLYRILHQPVCPAYQAASPAGPPPGDLTHRQAQQAF